MAKKKKTQLKPIARGFATTSLPKKVVPVQEDEAPSTPEQNPVALKEAEATASTTPEQDAPAVVASTAALESKEFDPDKVEEQSLQNLVDKLQEKVEKDIRRTVKGIQQDRRYAETLPSLDLDSRLIDRILDLVHEGRAEPLQEVHRPVNDTEEKAVARLGLTYGVLRRLGFSEERVIDCLSSISGYDLDEAYDWLCLHCSDDELDATRGDATAKDKLLPPSTPRTPRNGGFANEIPPLPTSPLPTSKPKLDASAPAFVPSRLAASLADANRLDLDDGGTATPSEIDSLDDDPNSEYIRLRLKLDDLTRVKPGTATAADDAFISQLHARLTAVKSHYFFDQKNADKAYKEERKRVDKDKLQSRLRGNKRPEPKSKPVTPQPVTPPPETRLTTDKGDVFDGGDDEGPMFEILDEMPTETIAPSGTTIRVRDMPLPKSSSARVPKKILQENAAKLDTYATITYRDISGSSRVKRANVAIRWSGGKADEFSMDDVACHDLTQAEQYIATIALHALTYRISEGFSGGGAPAQNPTFFRLLPPAYRVLWDELEEQRKLVDDSVNRDVWARLRTIVEQKMANQETSAPKIEKPILENRRGGFRRGNAAGQGQDPELLREAFLDRQASPAYQEMLAQRNSLPIAQYRQHIIETLEQSQVLVLSGETGCGKSTQLPAFILEDHLLRGQYAKIFCTEPRRISALSLAQRVSRELGDAPGAVGSANSLVGYSIRLESKIHRNTMLAYVTNGIALRMFEGGSEGGFDEVTHIIVDEVHERGIESDFLLLGLKSLLAQRPDLKIVLMSATLDAEKISAYFGGCPVLQVPGRTFPVDVKYLEDAVELTGWSIDENSQYAIRGNDKFHKGKKNIDWSEDAAPDDEDEDSNGPTPGAPALEKRYSQRTKTTISLYDERLLPYDLIVKLLECICFQDPYQEMSAAILVFMPGLGEIRRLNDILTDHPNFGSDHEFIIHPLHSTTSSDQQGAVFNVPPLGIRKIVIATNIAETGITIPDITCVIDTGKHREMRFDEKRQLSKLVETFVAKSNAAQRRGRAGRVQRGLCFHLFTKYRHDTRMAEHPEPEILRLSLADLALRTKTMKVNLGTSVEDILTKALDPPSPVNIQRAVSVLVEVRALTPDEEITHLGRLLMRLSLDVHLGKFLIMACLLQCLDPALTIAAALSAKSPFMTPFGHEVQADLAKNSFRVENSDFLTLHQAFSAWRNASVNKGAGFAREFCRKNYLSHQNLLQIKELREQFLSYLLDSGLIRVDNMFVKELQRTRYGRTRATKFINIPTELDSNSYNIHIVNAALGSGLYPKLLHVNPSTGQLTTISNNQSVAFHPSSVNFKRKPSDFGVNHLTYFTLMHSKKLYAWETGPVEDVAILLLCGDSEFKLASDWANVDRKVKLRVASPKANLALKHIRAQIASLHVAQLRSSPLTETQTQWRELAVMILGKLRIVDPDEGRIGIR